MVLVDLGPAETLALGAQWETLVFRERQDREDFRDYLGCPDLQDPQDLRVTVVLSATLVLLVLVKWVPLVREDLMDLQDLPVLVSKEYRDSGDPRAKLAAVVCQEVQVQWVHLATVNSVRLSGCKLMLDHRRRAELEEDEEDNKEREGQELNNIEKEEEGKIEKRHSIGLRKVSPTAEPNARNLTLTFAHGPVTFTVRIVTTTGGGSVQERDNIVTVINHNIVTTINVITVIITSITSLITVIPTVITISVQFIVATIPMAKTSRNVLPILSWMSLLVELTILSVLSLLSILSLLSLLSLLSVLTVLLLRKLFFLMSIFVSAGFILIKISSVIVIIDIRALHAKNDNSFINNVTADGDNSAVSDEIIVSFVSAVNTDRTVGAVSTSFLLTMFVLILLSELSVLTLQSVLTVLSAIPVLTVLSAFTVLSVMSLLSVISAILPAPVVTSFVPHSPCWAITYCRVRTIKANISDLLV